MSGNTTPENDAAPSASAADEHGDASAQHQPARFDFAHPEHRLQSRLPVLDLINERLAKTLSGTLSHAFHQPMAVRFLGNQSERLADYAESMPKSVSTTALTLSPLNGRAWLCIAGQLVHVLVDRYFGGRGESAEAEEAEAARDFSPTESRLINRCRDEFANALSTAWQSVHALAPEFGSEFTRLEMQSPANPAAVVISQRFEVILANGLGGEIHLITPYTLLEPVRAKLAHVNGASSAASGNHAWRMPFMQSVRTAEVELEAVVGEVAVTLKQLLELKEGDFIPLTQKRAVTFGVEGQALFEAEVGAENGMVAATFNRWH